MPQVNFNLSPGLLAALDDLVWSLRFDSRVSLVRELLSLFAPDLDCLALAQFLYRYFPDKIDELMAELMREGEVVRQ
jgi:hypothetical protein